MISDTDDALSSPMNNLSDMKEYAISPTANDPSMGATVVLEYLVFIIVPDIIMSPN